MGAGRAVRGLLPEVLQDKGATLRPAGTWPAPPCAPGDRARRLRAARDSAFDQRRRPALACSTLGISMVELPGAGCCGAVRFHLDDAEGARADARRNIDAWWPDIEAGRIRAIVMTASGCGVQVRDYGHLLQHDPVYAERARRVSTLTRDIAELVLAEGESLRARFAAARSPRAARLARAVHRCNGQRIRGTVESLLTAAGYELTRCATPTCAAVRRAPARSCSPRLSSRLRANKCSTPCSGGGAARIASANIGCITHRRRAPTNRCCTGSS